MKKFMIGCLAVGIVGVIACAILFWYVIIRELPTPAASLDAPGQVAVDATFELRVAVSNPHESAVTLDSIDIDDSFLEGFQVVSITPETTDTLHIFGQRSWFFDRELDPGETLDVVFNLKAVREGHFSGDIDVCNENQDFRTLLADIVVRPSE